MNATHGRRTWSIGLGTLVAVFLLPAVNAPGAEPAPPLDAATAWSEIKKLQQELHARPAWQGREPTAEELAAFQSVKRATALGLAQKARAFAARFPTNELAGDARFFATLALCRAVAAGDSGSEAELKRYVKETLADKSIPEDDRFVVLLGSGNLAVMKKLGMKEFTGRPGEFAEEREESTKASARAVIREFPGNGKGYTLLLAVAERAKGEEQKRLAQELLDMDGASKAVKSMARHVLNGTRPYQVGKPLDIRFTALDGRAVDLAKLKGKVVLIDFWSTDCPPCVGEMPELKELYEEFHPKGLEIVGISLDDKQGVLERFIRTQKLPWPQHYDGKGWENEFALRYGIFVVPTKWLVDRAGNLRFTENHVNLEQRMNLLIQESP